MLLDDKGETYKTFWKQAIHWLSIQNIQTEELSIKLDKSVYFLLEKAKISVECFDKEGNLIKDTKLTGNLFEPDGNSRRIQFVTSGDGKHTGKLNSKNRDK